MAHFTILAVIYNMDWTNQQFTDSFQPIKVCCRSHMFSTHAGETEIQGFELQGSCLLMINFNMDFEL